MKKNLRCLCFILVLCMILPVLSACKSNGGKKDETESETERPQVTLKLGENGKSQYTVIRPSDSDELVVKAAMSVRDALQNALGSNAVVKILEDYLYGDQKPGEYEILVGNTNREESENVLSEMKYLDKFTVICGKKIVINAYKPELIVECVEHFIEQIKDSKDGNVSFSTKNELLYRAEYKYDEIKIGDTAIDGYTIVYQSANNSIAKNEAYKLRENIALNSGQLLPINSDTAQESDKEILVGITSRTKIDPESLGEYGFEIAKDGEKIVIATNDNAFTLMKTVKEVLSFKESGIVPCTKGRIEVSKDPILTSMCFSDVHNNFSMLEPPYHMRKNVNWMIDEIVKTEGKVDIAVIGGDYMSDYPGWVTSGHLPYEYYLGFKKMTVETFEKITKDGKVLYVAGNHDYAQGEVYDPEYNKLIGASAESGPGKRGTYNSFDFYFTGPMDKTLGELEGTDKYVVEGKVTGEKYLLGSHHVVNGVHFVSLAPDHDIIWETQGYGFNRGSLKWLKAKLNEIDPNGTELIFFVCHYSPAQRNANSQDNPMKYDINDPGLDRSLMQDLAPCFKGHRNLIYLFGHWHVFNDDYKSYFKDYTVPNMFHYNKSGQIMQITGKETESTEIITNFNSLGYSAIWMGGFRYDYVPSLFGDDAIEGYGGQLQYNPITHNVLVDKFGKPWKQVWGPTATPKFAQGLYFEVFEDRVEFTMKNIGDYPNYSTEDKIAPYVFYLYK